MVKHSYRIKKMKQVEHYRLEDLQITDISCILFTWDCDLKQQKSKKRTEYFITFKNFCVLYQKDVL